MKKSFKTLTLGLLTIGMLAGCGQKPAPTWSSEDAKTMSDNLYGVVLPFVSLNNSKVEYDSTEKQVKVTGDELESTAIAAYAQNFKESDGWVDLSSEAGQEFYSFEKQVFNDKNEKRWVAVQFGNRDAEPASSGDNTGPLQADGDEPAGGEGQGEGQEQAAAKQFTILAADPYEYEFDKKALKDWIKDLTNVTVSSDFPAFQADRYSRISVDNMNLLVCFTDDANAGATYKAQFEANPYNWNVKTATDEYVASDATEKYTIRFSYSADMKALIVYGYNFTDWPQISFANALKVLDQNITDVVPQVDGFNVVFVESKYVAQGYPVMAQIYVKEGTGAAAAEAYATKLTSEAVGFTEEVAFGEKVYVSPNRQFQIDFKQYLNITSEKCFEFNMSLVSADTTTWPSARIDAHKQQYGLTATIPAFEATGATYNYQYYASADILDVYVFAENLTLTDYVALITNDTYKFKAGGSTSSGGQIYEYTDAGDIGTRLVLNLDSANNTLEIYILAFDVDHNFPYERFAEALSFEDENLLPEFSVAGALWKFQEGTYKLAYYAFSELEGEGADAQAFADITAAFDASTKFVISGEKSATLASYLSTDGKYKAYVYIPQAGNIGVQIEKIYEFEETAPLAFAMSFVGIDDEVDYTFDEFKVEGYVWEIHSATVSASIKRVVLWCVFPIANVNDAFDAQDAFLAATADDFTEATYSSGTFYEYNEDTDFDYRVSVVYADNAKTAVAFQLTIEYWL